jgi:hypothetical protein
VIESVPRSLFLASACACALYCALAAAKTWPVIDGDGTAYFPAAVEWSEGRALTNPVWLPPLDDSIDGPGGRRFIYHGFLYAIVVGSIARTLGGGAEATVAAAYVLHWLAAVVAALAVLSWSRAPRALHAVLAAVLPIAMLACSIAWHGRVEPLALVLVGMAALAWRHLDALWREAVAGVASALLVFTTPACGAIGLLALVAALAAAGPPSELLRRGVAASAGLCVGLLIAVAVFPYPIADWIAGVMRHSRINLSLPIGQGFVPTWIASPQLPLLAISIAILLTMSAARVREALSTLPRERRLVLLGAAGLFVGGLIRLALVKTEASYNAVVYVPLLAALALAAATSRVRAAAAMAALLLPAAGVMRSAVILAGQFEAAAVPFETARHELRRLTGNGCVVTAGLWLASDDPASLRVANPNRPEGACFVRQESMLGQSAPPAYDGYMLVDDRYRRGASAFGLPIARTTGGWEFAVYVEERSAAQ